MGIHCFTVDLNAVCFLTPALSGSSSEGHMIHMNLSPRGSPSKIFSEDYHKPGRYCCQLKFDRQAVKKSELRWNFSAGWVILYR